jgi:CheY-like chemotaxis protein
LISTPLAKKRLKMARVLIIDDSMLMRLKLRTILEKGQHDVIDASSGEEGLVKMMTKKPELIILDFLMPDMNGPDVLRKMHELKINIPVVICSANIQETAKKECFDLGIKKFFNKPPDEKKLLDAVKTFSN